MRRRVTLLPGGFAEERGRLVARSCSSASASRLLITAMAGCDSAAEFGEVLMASWRASVQDDPQLAASTVVVVGRWLERLPGRGG